MASTLSRRTLRRFHQDSLVSTVTIRGLYDRSFISGRDSDVSVRHRAKICSRTHWVYSQVDAGVLPLGVNGSGFEAGYSCPSYTDLRIRGSLLLFSYRPTCSLITVTILFTFHWRWQPICTNISCRLEKNICIYQAFHRVLKTEKGDLILWCHDILQYPIWSRALVSVCIGTRRNKTNLNSETA